MKKIIIPLLFAGLSPLLSFAQKNNSNTQALIDSYRTGGLHFFNGADSAKLSNGDITPDFQVVDTSKKQVHFSELKGKYVMIDIWASWCTWCIKEYPSLEQLKTQLAGKNITFVSLSCDQNVPAWLGAIGNYKMKSSLQWLVVDQAFMKAFEANRIPRFILLDPKGKVYNDDMLRPSNPKTLDYLLKLKGI